MRLSKKRNPFCRHWQINVSRFVIFVSKRVLCTYYVHPKFTREIKLLFFHIPSNLCNLLIPLSWLQDLLFILCRVSFPLVYFLKLESHNKVSFQLLWFSYNIFLFLIVYVLLYIILSEISRPIRGIVHVLVSYDQIFLKSFQSLENGRSMKIFFTRQIYYCYGSEAQKHPVTYYQDGG